MIGLQFSLTLNGFFCASRLHHGKKYSMIYENVVPYEHILSEKVILKEGMKNKGQKEKR